MVEVRKSGTRGSADHGWLKSHHTFSFAEYMDPRYMGFRDLRVINEDYIADGRGFGTHPHRDMEIVTIVRSGQLRHADSLGNTSVIVPGEVQRMTAGTGIRHSEFSVQGQGETHLFQIWILPDAHGYQPAYGQKSFASRLKRESLVLVVSKTGREGSLTMNQDADLYLGRLSSSRPKIDFELRKNRHAYVQVMAGALKLNHEELKAGDGAAVDEENKLIFEGAFDASSSPSSTEFLLFDLP